MRSAPLEFFAPIEFGDLLLAILPMHAQRIYSGDKTFELRKVLPTRIPRRVYLYESKRGVITGHFIVESAICGSPNSLWQYAGEKATSSERFFAYFKNRPVACAFAISSATKYKTPVSLRKLANITEAAAPQNFIYLENLPDLRRELHNNAKLEALARNRRPFLLEPIGPESEELFITLTDRHITGRYKETGDAYPRKLIEIHRSTEDNEGIFTTSKTVLEIRKKGVLVGFVVLTEKLGGCVKTGPVLFLDEYQRQGFGQQLRVQLHKFLGAVGFRKVYCTSNVSNAPAVNYLLSSNYRIEAHLKAQYRHDSDELVFGFPLSNGRGAAEIRPRTNEPVETFAVARRIDPIASSFLENEFRLAICEVPVGWGGRQVDAAVSRMPGFKPRLVFTAVGGGTLKAAALVALKRGGAAKVLLVTSVDHVQTLARFLSFIEDHLANLKGGRPRKLYGFVGTDDRCLQQTFYSRAFHVEGVLDRPYRSSQDMLVFVKDAGQKDIYSAGDLVRGSNR